MALIFMKDELHDVLAPIADSKGRKFVDYRAVGTRYGDYGEILGGGSTPTGTGIATIAFQDGAAISINPENDKRFSLDSHENRKTYGINGSLIAVRIDGEGSSQQMGH